ncbi:MAG: hypothetical protein H6819_09145 [Phycisphaerales bacterium]|nr:hypothetical protein [Phycisphaerales bacterium]MCB9856007.1 hypothetical protein [Phycisphaerales bacterium]MCB9864966.1 hypothetical protein [Phycisphaerales bacterium]
MEIEDTSFPVGDSGVADEVRIQRRKAAFRRHASSVLIGAVLVVCVVFWQRNQSSIQRCGDSLTAYGNLSAAMHLEREPVELIESSWLAIHSDAPYGAGHYKVISINWIKQPDAGDGVPLAMCAESHGSLSGRGRNVLYRTTTGLETRWLDEEAAQAMLASTTGSPN